MQRIPPWRAYRLLHPKMVTVIGAAHEGRVNFMPASWVMPVSFDPPLIAAAIGSERYTLELVRGSGEYTVNPVSADMLDTVMRLGAASGRTVDKAGIARPAAALEVGAPCLEGALGCIEARVEKLVEAGDHVLAIARVVAARAWRCFDTSSFMYREGCGPVYHAGGDTFMLPGRLVRA